MWSSEIPIRQWSTSCWHMKSITSGEHLGNAIVFSTTLANRLKAEKCTTERIKLKSYSGHCRMCHRKKREGVSHRNVQLSRAGGHFAKLEVCWEERYDERK